jgi:Asp-tRNA(Asn)/Glu-tRNA(Gln) amidotransferase A subunit family amidase
MLEAGLKPRYGRVATEGVIPYARHLEDAALPNVERIREAALKMLEA